VNVNASGTLAFISAPVTQTEVDFYRKAVAALQMDWAPNAIVLAMRQHILTLPRPIIRRRAFMVFAAGGATAVRR